MYSDTMIMTLTQVVGGMVGSWGLPLDTPVRLLTVSENATFIATPSDGNPVILRVHRPGYHTEDEIKSELNWIADLRAKGVVETPEPLALVDGTSLARIDVNGQCRFVAAFTFMAGKEPSAEENLTHGFHKLGAISARLHGHARTWHLPQGFTRKTWTFETTLGDRPHWGPWRAALSLSKDGERLLERTCGALHAKLATYGETEDRFGLIHADLRLANLLVDGEHLGVIDFDDCGFGWYGYDFAAAISFLETDPMVCDLQESWLEGYRTVSPYSVEDEKMLPTFIMLRRLLLTAWIASHAETSTAKDAGGPAYTDGTLVLAERFLASP